MMEYFVLLDTREGCLGYLDGMLKVGSMLVEEAKRAILDTFGVGKTEVVSESDTFGRVASRMADHNGLVAVYKIVDGKVIPRH